MIIIRDVLDKLYNGNIKYIADNVHKLACENIDIYSK